MTTTSLPELKDEGLWRLAKKRASFKRHLITYVIVNTFLWAVWFFTGRASGYDMRFPSPLWTTLGWGIGLAFHYASAYLYTHHDQTEREYQKLKNNQL